MLVFAGGSCIAAQADHHIFLKANLILGTNKEQKDKMEALPEIKDKLSKVFKWKYYYRLNRKKIELKEKETKPVQLSRSASIMVTNIKKNKKISVGLYSEGRMLVQKTQALKPGKHMVLAGNTESDSAWFIVLSRPL